MALDLTKVFKGIQLVKALPATPEKGVIYFVREHKDDQPTGNASVYFGDRLYGNVEATRLAEIESSIESLGGRVDAIEAALGTFVKVSDDLNTVAKVVAKHEERLNDYDDLIDSANQNASQALQTAQQAVVDVTAQVNAANAAKTAAETARDEASASATAAAQSASDADGHASIAEGHALDAAGSATLAGEKASAADASATLAGEKASAADQSAEEANAHKDDAGIYAGQAETARDEAESAKAGAEAAKTAAEAAKKAAEDLNTSATAIATKAAEDAAKAMKDAADALDSVKDGVNFKGVVGVKPETTEGYNVGDIIIVGKDEYIAGEEGWILLGNINPAIEQITTEIEKLDATVEDKSKKVAVTIVETDGKLTSITVDDTAMVNYVDAAVSAIDHRLYYGGDDAE